MKRPSYQVALSFATIILLAISGLHHYDWTTWLLEIFPILIALPVLIVTHRRFPFTTLLYGLMFLHAVVLMVGGAYSYARVPLGFQIEEWLHLSRNPYDKIGHFFQGFVPTMVTRELLLRGHYVKRGKMLVFLMVCVALAISATYELIEWAAAIALGQGADEFLGTQGDVWDTQSDMLMALVGALAAVITLSSLHDKQLRRLSHST